MQPEFLSNWPANRLIHREFWGTEDFSKGGARVFFEEGCTPLRLICIFFNVKIHASPSFYHLIQKI